MSPNDPVMSLSLDAEVPRAELDVRGAAWVEDLRALATGLLFTLAGVIVSGLLAVALFYAFFVAAPVIAAAAAWVVLRPAGAAPPA